MSYKWASLLGKFEQTNESIVFKGETISYSEGKSGPSIGNLIFDQSFGGLHSTLKCNKRRSDFNWCFKTQALSWAIINQRFDLSYLPT